MNFTENKKTILIILLLISMTLIFSFYFQDNKNFKYILNNSDKDLKKEILKNSDINILNNPITTQNLKTYDSINKEVTIKDDTNKDLIKIKLLDNTDQCLINCYSIIEVKSLEDLKNPTDIKQNIKFKDEYGNLKYLDYKIYKKNVTIQSFSMPIYEKLCNDVTNINGTQKICNDILRGYEIKYINNTQWDLIDLSKLTFNKNDITYLKIEAKKEPFKKVDWLPTFEGIEINEWAWFNSSWEKRKSLFLTNATVNYSYPFDIPYNPDFNADFSDLRFTNSSNFELSYWIETKNLTNARIWVKIDNNDTIYLYYKNSLATTTSNENTTFVYYDTFSGNTLNPIYWNCTGFSCTVSSSELNITGATAQISVMLKPFNFSNVYVQFRGKASGNAQHGALLRSQNNKAIEQSLWFTQLIYNRDNNGGGGLYLVNGGTYGAINTDNADGFQAGKYYTTKAYSVGKEINKTAFNDSGAFSMSKRGSNDTFKDGYVGLFQNTGASPATYDYFFVTNWIYPQPTYTTGSEETLQALYLNLTFQDPIDITSITAINRNVNITYSATSPTTIKNITLFTFINGTINGCRHYLNGTNHECNFVSLNYSYYNNSNYTFLVDDNELYPASYNFENEYMENTPKLNFNISSTNEIAKIRLFNVSNTTQYNLLEINVRNNTFNSNPLNIYYCNSTYTNSSLNSNYCTLFRTIQPSEVYNHSHTASNHYMIILPINNQTGFINTVKVTARSYFLLNVQSGVGSWSIRYISNISRNDTFTYSNNGGASYQNINGTPDLHLHQFKGTEAFLYYALVYDINNNSLNDSYHFDYLDLGGIRPSQPTIITPTNITYKDSLYISYFASISPNGYNISYYNVSLFNSSNNYIKTIITTQNLFYNWSIIGENDGSYKIGVQAKDILNQTSIFGLSDVFSIFNNNPLNCINDTVYATFTTYPYIAVNQTFNIYLQPIPLNYSTIKIDLTDKSNNNMSIFNFTFNPYNLSYDLSLMFSAIKDYNFTIYSNFHCPTLATNITGNLYVRVPFNVDFRAYIDLNKTPYINEFAYLTAEYTNRLNDPYLDPYIPLRYSTIRTNTPTFHTYYRNGRATITLYEPNQNYTFRLLDGVINWQQTYSKPIIIKSYGTEILAGSTYLNGTNNTLIEAYLTPKDIHPYRWLFNTLLWVLLIITFLVSLGLIFILPEYPFYGFILGTALTIIILTIRLFLWLGTGN